MELTWYRDYRTIHDYGPTESFDRSTTDDDQAGLGFMQVQGGGGATAGAGQRLSGVAANRQNNLLVRKTMQSKNLSSIPLY